MDIVIHLQATLQMDIGGEPAKALSDFYVAMFALMLQGSQEKSRVKFEHVIACVLNVRDAWRQVARDSQANITAASPMAAIQNPAVGPGADMRAASWTA
jgi:flagellar protein FliS